ncbi:MAG: hypothetical protein PHN49_06220 [Candidatus Omnitrophica bacterium]|nr:hypothetical protein [Candidatus Omnitrophota bacterium]
MKKIFALFFVYAFVTIAVPVCAADQDDSYLKNMGHDLVRGVKNVFSCPLEIPIKIKEYHQKEGRPVIREMAGFADGFCSAFVRGTSGAWDFLAAFWIGDQDGMPVNPETLF